jgi:hypothetical protein
MEPLWSRAVAIGGSRWQTKLRKPRRRVLTRLPGDAEAVRAAFHQRRARVCRVETPGCGKTGGPPRPPIRPGDSPESNDMNRPLARLLDCGGATTHVPPLDAACLERLRAANMKGTIRRIRQPHAADEPVGRGPYTPCGPALDIRDELVLPDRSPATDCPKSDSTSRVSARQSPISPKCARWDTHTTINMP